MSRFRRRGRGASALVAALLLACAPAAAAADTPVVFTMSDPRIRAATGLTRDTGHNVYWTVNESDPTGRVYAVGPGGQTRGTLDFNIKPVQIEAVELADTRLYVADIGDPTRSRTQITIYWFDNAAPDDTRAGSYRAWDFTYPDGPHDASAILVDRRGQLLIVTKEQRGGIYQAPRSPRGAGTNMLTRVADAPAYVTDGVVLPDGRLALRTYTTLEILDQDLFDPAARAALPFQSKGESIAVSMDGRNLLLGNAATNAQVLQVPVPTTLVDVPPAQPSPPAPPAPTPTPTPAPEEGGTNRTGTLLALLAALVVSVLAGVVVLFARRRGDGDARRDDYEDTTVLGRRSGSTAVTFDDDRTVVRPRRSWADDTDEVNESREIFRRGRDRGGDPGGPADDDDPTTIRRRT